jgi:hypothetical protein
MIIAIGVCILCILFILSIVGIYFATKSSDEKDMETTEPEYTEPEYTEPEYTESEYTEPEYTEPEYTESEYTESDYTESEYTYIEPTEPVYTTLEPTTTLAPDEFVLVARGTSGAEYIRVILNDATVQEIPLGKEFSTFKYTNGGVGINKVSIQYFNDRYKRDVIVKKAELNGYNILDKMRIVGREKDEKINAFIKKGEFLWDGRYTYTK